MIVFNIEKYGDFDVPATVLTVAGPEGMSKKIAREVAKEAEELFKNSNDEAAVAKYLKGWGCTGVNAIDITIGGNL